jgi:hypothetical protein
VGEERRTYHWGADQTSTRRLLVREAAQHLGISEDAVRMRVKRGTLAAEREGTRLYILLTPDPTTDPTPTRTDELIAELRDRVRSLEEQMQEEREANRENRRIIAALTSRIPAIEAPQEPSETPSEATEQPGRGEEPQPSVEGAQEPRESPEMAMREVGGGPLTRDQQTPSERPWWRRMFGG